MVFGKIKDFITGTKRPDPNTPVQSKEEVHKRLLAVNRKTAPFQVRLSKEDEPGDLVAEWKIVDATWYEIFAKAHLQKVFRVFLKYEDSTKEVRSMDREFSVSWKAGIPSLSFSAQAFQGQKMSVEGGTGYAFTEEFKPGQVYKYRFSTKELKTPLRDAITGAGWTYKGVVML